MQTLVLASSSPFRKTILDKLNLPYTTHSPNIDESAHKNESPAELVCRLAEQKARAVRQQYPDALIIGSDQVAILDGTIIGKPHTHEKATEQLRNTSGRIVTFLTGLSLYNAQTERMQTDVVPFTVHFRQLSERMIENYLLAEKPYNCAGSFKSEGLGIALFNRLEGDDPNTLIGLPLIRLIQMLEAENIPVLG